MGRYATGSTRDLASECPDAKWGQQQGQKQGSDDEGARLHGGEPEYSHCKKGSATDCLKNESKREYVTPMLLRVLVTLESVDRAAGELGLSLSPPRI